MTVCALVAWHWRVERRGQSAQVLAMRARFARALDHARDAMLIVSTDGRILDANLEAERLSGYPRQTLIGLHVINDLCAVDRRSDARLGIGRALLRGPEALHETVAIRADGTRVPVEVSGRIALMDDQRLVVCVARDISDRIVAQQRESRQSRIIEITSEINKLIVREADRPRLLQRACELLTEHGGYPLAWIGLPDASGRLEVAAAAGIARAYLEGIEVRWDETPAGMGPGGRAWREGRPVIMRADDPDFAPWQAKAAEHNLAACGATILNSEDTPRGVLLLYSPLADEFSADLVKLLGQLGDDLGFALATIERREALAAAEAQRRELNEKLRRLHRVEELGQLSGGVAHDFNNLLTVILSNLSLLATDLPRDIPGLKSYLQDIEDAARRGSDLVRKLLAIGRQKKLAIEALDAAAVLAGSQRMLRRVIPENVDIRCAIDPDLPRFSGDAGAVEQTLLNLATNARDAMPAGGQLTLRAESVTLGQADAEAHEADPGPYIVISVEDTGTGMDPVTASRVFEPFFTTKEVGKGTGLGLAMVFGLMHQQRGFVRIVTSPGKGTSMRLHFPVATAEQAAASAQVTRAGPAGREAPGGSETILVVEDEPALRLAAKRCLARRGYQVIEACDGEDGWAQFEQHRQRIQLVISDAVMPRLSGPALLARIRASGSMVPFMLSSGYADTVNNGVTGEVPLLPKPWTADELTSRVREVIDRTM